MLKVKGAMEKTSRGVLVEFGCKIQRNEYWALRMTLWVSELPAQQECEAVVFAALATMQEKLGEELSIGSLEALESILPQLSTWSQKLRPIAIKDIERVLLEKLKVFGKLAKKTDVDVKLSKYMLKVLADATISFPLDVELHDLQRSLAEVLVVHETTAMVVEIVGICTKLDEIDGYFQMLHLLQDFLQFQGRVLADDPGALRPALQKSVEKVLEIVAKNPPEVCARG